MTCAGMFFGGVGMCICLMPVSRSSQWHLQASYTNLLKTPSTAASICLARLPTLLSSPLLSSPMASLKLTQTLLTQRTTAERENKKQGEMKCPLLYRTETSAVQSWCGVSNVECVCVHVCVCVCVCVCTHMCVCVNSWHSAVLSHP